jgi:branched-chain amino acid transport system ATP-binding protein
MLQLNDVTAMIAGVPVLRGVTAHVDAGETVAVVGRNGAGKTTLLRAIMGLLPLRSGRITLHGERVGDHPPHARSALGIGYAPEDRILFPSFSVEDNLRFPCEVLRLPREQLAARLDEVLSIVPELRELLPRAAAGLSGGQGKMAALGRALMVGTRLVLLDEPFQGLAPVLAQRYAQALRRLQTIRPELSVVITESNLALLKGVPTRRLALERGSLAVDAPAAPGQSERTPA